MYNLREFKGETEEQVFDFMLRHPFIMLTGVNAGLAIVTHVPVLLDVRDGKIFLMGHIMIKTDHHKAFQTNNNVLAVFNGPHSYVSASWYKNPKQGSTWNYMTVHARGIIRFLDNNALLDILSRTTARFENDINSPSLVNALPVEYLHKMIPAIAGFEIEVMEINHVFKLSQNRDAESYNNIITQLAKGDANAREIAELMQQRIKGRK